MIHEEYAGLSVNVTCKSAVSGGILIGVHVQ